MNALQSDPDEFDRITRILKSGIKGREFAMGFPATLIGDYARCIGVATNRRSELSIAMELVWNVNNAKPVVQHNQPDGVDPTAPICDGCGGFGTSIKNDQGEFVFRRWGKASAGIPVSVSFDMSKAPLVPGYSIEAIKELFQIISDFAGTGLNFDFLTKGKGDIHYKHADLPGSQMGATWVPRAKDALMESGGDLSGDISMDYSRQWLLWQLLVVAIHEILHAIGAPHSSNPVDLSYLHPTALQMRGLGPGDRFFISNAYPELHGVAA